MGVKQSLKNYYSRLPVVRELRQLRDAAVRLADQTFAIRRIKVNEYVTSSLRDDVRYGDPRRLSRSAWQVCSQNGEDGMIHEIFRRLHVDSGVFVEVGVGDGSQNNTAFLLSMGWTGFWIEGAPQFLATTAVLKDLPTNRLRVKNALVTKENVAGLFEELGVPGEFELLSLDIDRNTYHAWEGLEGFRPAVVVVEYNASLPPDVKWVVNYDADKTWDGTINYGASLKAFELLGRKRGYCLVGCDFIGVNAFFVREDLVGEKFAAPYTAENHYEPPRYYLANRNAHPSTILDRV